MAVKVYKVTWYRPIHATKSGMLASGFSMEIAEKHFGTRGAAQAFLDRKESARVELELDSCYRGAIIETELE